MSLKNRYEIMFYVSCPDAAFNGETKNSNVPVVNPNNKHGLLQPNVFKRRIRNYVDSVYGNDAGLGIVFRRGGDLNRSVDEDRKSAKAKGCSVREANQAAWAKTCERYFDVRTFGAVVNEGPNAGSVRGPVQFAFAESVNVLATADTNRYGLYEVRCFVDACCARISGFSDRDFQILLKAIAEGMNCKDLTLVSPLILFKHVGISENDTDREKEAVYGCARSEDLMDLVSIKLMDGVDQPRDHRDFTAVVHSSKLPRGIEIGFLTSADEICWGHLPAGENWITTD